jgi:hypothetical protein
MNNRQPFNTQATSKGCVENGFAEPWPEREL